MRTGLSLFACCLGAASCLGQPINPPGFDSSGIALNALTEVQVDNLAILGKVWGFLKYHHLAATSGQRDWDRELLEVMPRVLSSQDRQSADAAILKWVEDLGPVGDCDPCVLPPDHPALYPDTHWLEDQALLGRELSSSLRRIYRNRTPGRQWYAALAVGPQNVEFPHEASYPEMQTDFSLQVLAVYRFWNVIAYWYPYRDLIPSNWDEVLRKYIREVGLVHSARDYQLGMLKLAALITDSHEWLHSAARPEAPVSSGPPEGTCILPVAIRFVEDKPVVIDVLVDGIDLRRGDVLEEIDGTPVATLLREMSPYHGESNDAARLRNIALGMTRGACGGAGVRLLRGDQDRSVEGRRVPLAGIRKRWIQSGTDHTLVGPAVRVLEGKIGYVKASGTEFGEISDFLNHLGASITGLIVDLRGQPTSWIGNIAGNLIERRTPFARSTIADLSNPGAFLWKPEMAWLDPISPREYPGKIVVLVDEMTQSFLEFNAMAFRSAGAPIVGSTTAGADGNVSELLLPGNLQVRITGAGVFYPDGRKTQQVGIIPDLSVAPTIAGITKGRDEVLEAAEHLIRQ
jgi:hypothetical protein